MPDPLPADAVVFFNGAFMPASEARYGLQERGVLFGDGVYEVVRYDRSKAFAMQPHVDRLAHSLDGIRLLGVDPARLADWSDELMARNEYADGKAYWQVTRGDAGTRDFVMPGDGSGVDPTVVLIAYPGAPVDADAPLQTGTAIVVEDCRWTKCWIKSTLLLPASMAKTAALHAGATEAVFERQKPGTPESHITEGASTNVLIVRGGELHTHPNDGWILGGITRRVLMDLAVETLAMPVRELCFTAEELFAADEVLVCSTTQLTAVTAVNGRPIADGKPGPVTEKLHRVYLEQVLGG